MSSEITIASTTWLSRDTLAKVMIDAGKLPDDTAIIDVRDDDHIGGHIKGSTNVPSSTLDWRMPELVRTLKDKDRVIFHCALSQQRGPKAAITYLRERRRLLGEARDEGKQEVCVLDGGFVRWQEKYGKDVKLTDAYVPDIWAEY